jgi:hypothetical protein
MMKIKLCLAMTMVLALLSLNVYAQVPGYINPFGTNDPEYMDSVNRRPYSLRLIGAGDAWTITKGCPDVIVGVVDTEFDTNHVDLRTTFEGVYGTRLPVAVTDTTHGTNMTSGIATGTNNGVGIAGIGYNTRVRGYHAMGVDDTLWNRIWRAYEDGIKIINVSWTSIGYKPNRRDSLQQMVNDGVVLVVGAGNDTIYYYHSSYANIPGIINVSAVDTLNYHGGTNTAQNQWVDVCAVARFVPVCQPRNPIDIYGNVGGSFGVTSIAAAQVSGTVALIRSVNSFLSADSIEKIIKITADTIADANLFPGQLGAGRVNAYKAVLRVKQQVCGTTNTFSKTIQKINESVNGGNVIISNTTVKTGRRLSVGACNSVTINGPFVMEAGSMLDININPYP